MPYKDDRKKGSLHWVGPSGCIMCRRQEKTKHRKFVGSHRGVDVVEVHFVFSRNFLREGFLAKIFYVRIFFPKKCFLRKIFFIMKIFLVKFLGKILFGGNFFQ